METLSDFIEYIVVRRVSVPESKELVLSVPKVKEFIRRLKDENCTCELCHKAINKLAGPALIHSPQTPILDRAIRMGYPFKKPKTTGKNSCANNHSQLPNGKREGIPKVKTHAKNTEGKQSPADTSDNQNCTNNTNKSIGKGCGKDCTNSDFPYILSESSNSFIPITDGQNCTNLCGCGHPDYHHIDGKRRCRLCWKDGKVGCKKFISSDNEVYENKVKGGNQDGNKEI